MPCVVHRTFVVGQARHIFLSDRRRTPLPVRSCFAAPVAAMKAVILLAAVAGAVRSRGAWAWPAHQPWPAHRFAGAAACARRRAGLGCQAARCARAVRAAGASAWLAFRLVRNATPCTKRWQGVGQPPPRCDALSGLERAPRVSTRGCLAKPPAAYTERRTNCRVARLALTRARASSLPAAERARALAGPQDAAGHHHHRRAEPRCVEASERPGCATLTSISVADLCLCSRRCQAVPVRLLAADPAGLCCDRVQRRRDGEADREHAVAAADAAVPEAAAAAGRPPPAAGPEDAAGYHYHRRAEPGCVLKA